MPVIDERGRIFGRLNLIDVAVAVLAVVVAAGVYVGYRLLRVPPAPVVERVEPQVQPGGDGRRLALRGRNFLPYMRVFIQRTGDSAKAIHELSPRDRIDQYTLVNGTQTRFLVESPQVAEVWLPPNVGVGTYDLVFYNESQRIGVKEAAFQLTEIPKPPPPPATPRARIRAYGVFRGIPAGNVPALRVGQLPADDKAWAEILELGAPRPETAPVKGREDVAAPVEGRVEIPAVLRVRCIVTAQMCNTPGGNLTLETTLPVLIGHQTLNFFVDDIGPDTTELVREAQVTVRFITKPEVARLVKVNDVDKPKPIGYGHSQRSAVLSARGAAEPMTSTTNVSLIDTPQTFVVQEGVVAVQVTVTVPVVQMPTGWFYKGQPVKAGAALTFETADYVVRGTILNVAVSKATTANQ